MVAYAQDRVAEGWEVIRFGVGEGSDAEWAGVYEQSKEMRWTVEAFAALRDAVGPEIEICVDLHQLTTPLSSMKRASKRLPRVRMPRCCGPSRHCPTCGEPVKPSMWGTSALRR